jgi:hypothetical protein
VAMGVTIHLVLLRTLTAGMMNSRNPKEVNHEQEVNQ